jgi:hypothetical protein
VCALVVVVVVVVVVVDVDVIKSAAASAATPATLMAAVSAAEFSVTAATNVDKDGILQRISVGEITIARVNIRDKRGKSDVVKDGDDDDDDDDDDDEDDDDDDEDSDDTAAADAAAASVASFISNCNRAWYDKETRNRE